MYSYYLVINYQKYNKAILINLKNYKQRNEYDSKAIFYYDQFTMHLKSRNDLTNFIIQQYFSNKINSYIIDENTLIEYLEGENKILLDNNNYDVYLVKPTIFDNNWDIETLDALTINNISKLNKTTYTNNLKRVYP